MGCAFGGLILAAAFGSALVAALLVRSPRNFGMIAGVAVGAGVTVAAGFALAVKRVAGAFAEQNRLRRRQLADLAHELRTPLAILQGRIEGLADGIYPRDDAELQGLLDETRHLGRLVEDLGTLAVAEAGALELRRERVDLEELLRDAARAMARPVELEVEPGLPAVDVDPVRVRQVVLNLLSNADHHTRAEGTIAIRARASGRGVEIRVEDSGSGIAAADLPRVFERFHKSPGSRGSGLGLSIARDLVRAHGGTIRAESEVGKGTVMVVTLPG